MFIWIITGTLFVILFAVSFSKFDGCGTKFDELGTKCNPIIPKWSNVRLYDQIHPCQKIVPSSSKIVPQSLNLVPTSYQLPTNSREENDGRGPHDTPHNMSAFTKKIAEVHQRSIVRCAIVGHNCCRPVGAGREFDDAARPERCTMLGMATLGISAQE